MRQKRGIVIGVYSAKGGVGKTTTVVNLGATLAQKLKGEVIAVETNMTASNLGLYLGILDPPVVIQDVVFGKAKVTEAILSTDSGVDLIPGSVVFTEEVGSIDLRGILDEVRKKYQLILLDSAPGFAVEVFAGLKACDELLIVCQPQVPAIAGTLQTFRAADRLKIPVLGVVLNRVTKKRYEIPIMDIKKTLAWPIISVVPEDDMVPEAVTRGMPVVMYASNSPAAIEFRKLGQIVLNHLKARKRVFPRKRKL